MFLDPRPADTATSDAFAEWAQGQTARWGFRPNYVALFAARPDVAAAWTALNLAVSGNLDRRRFEIVTIAAALERRSTYCATAHSVMLSEVAGDPATARTIALDGALDPADRQLFEFARKAAARPADVEAADIDALRDVGLSDTEIADVIFAVAARCFFATALDAAGIETDPTMASRLDDDVAAALVRGRPVGSD